MPRTRGGIDLGSSLESTAEVPLHANGYYPTEADLLAPGQLRHVTWLLYVVATTARYYIKPLAECVMADGSPATRAQWGTLLAHYKPAGVGLTAQQASDLQKAIAAVRVSVVGQPDKFYSSLLAAALDLGNDFDRTTVNVLSSEVITGAEILVTGENRVVGNGARLEVGADGVLELNAVEGLYLATQDGTNGYLALNNDVHNCTVGAASITGVVTATDTRFIGATQLKFGPDGVLRIGPGCGNLLDALYYPGGVATPFFTPTATPGTYTTPYGGTVIDERGGGVTAPVLDIYAVSAAKREQVKSLFSGDEFGAADVPLPDDPVTNYLGKRFPDPAGGDFYECAPNPDDVYQDTDGNSYAKPYWFRY